MKYCCFTLTTPKMHRRDLAWSVFVAIYEIPIEACHEYDTWQWIYIDAKKTVEKGNFFLF